MFSRTNTTVTKFLCALAVAFHHFYYNEITFVPSSLAVTVFFFISGYGYVKSSTGLWSRLAGISAPLMFAIGLSFIWGETPSAENYNIGVANLWFILVLGYLAIVYYVLEKYVKKDWLLIVSLLIYTFIRTAFCSRLFFSNVIVCPWGFIFGVAIAKSKLQEVKLSEKLILIAITIISLIVVFRIPGDAGTMFCVIAIPAWSLSVFGVLALCSFFSHKLPSWALKVCKQSNALFFVHYFTIKICEPLSDNYFVRGLYFVGITVVFMFVFNLYMRLINKYRTQVVKTVS